MGQAATEDPPVVLLVEDEPLVRMTVTDELEEVSFHVLEAANTDVALEVLEARFDEMQVLFTDVDTPGSMDGMALAARAAADLVRLRPHPDELPGHGHFVAKPYLAEAVWHIRGILDLSHVQ
jgi:CheY-like chemotaxis protein